MKFWKHFTSSLYLENTTSNGKSKYESARVHGTGRAGALLIRIPKVVVYPQIEKVEPCVGLNKRGRGSIGSIFIPWA